MFNYRYYVYGMILVAGIAVALVVYYPKSTPVTRSSPPPPSRISSNANEIVLGNLALEAPEGWIMERPSSAMRVGQFKLPGAEGDREDAELAVFSGIGGGVSANLRRWFSQFEQSDGTPSERRAVTRKSSIGGMPVTFADLSGTFVGSGMGMGGAVNEPGYRLLAAIVEVPDDVYYFKLVGPEATLEKWADSFERFIQSIRRL